MRLCFLLHGCSILVFQHIPYWDANVPGQGFKWEFKGKGTTPSFGFIANCTFSR